jgi:uncharacterized membrane protein
MACQTLVFKATLDPMRRATLVLALLGAGIAGYLTWVHYAGLEVVCLAGGGGCEKVQSSDYAELAGVPVAVLGLIGYLGILASLLMPEEPGRLAAAFLSLVGFGFSMYLTWAELFRIHAICQWCVASAVIMTALTVISLVRLLRYDGPRTSASPDSATAHSATDAPAAISRR